MMSSWAAKNSEQPSIRGEGITRNTGGGTSLFTVLVAFKPPAKPVRSTIRASNSEEALRFAIARHPNCDPIKTRLIQPLK